MQAARIREYNILSATSAVLLVQNAPKLLAAPDSAGGAHDAPPDPLVGWGEASPQTPHPRRLRRLDSRACGARPQGAQNFRRPRGPKYLNPPLGNNDFFWEGARACVRATRQLTCDFSLES